MGDSMTARDVRDALHQRYNRPSQGRPGERYVCLEEARAGAGFAGNAGQCDFLAINTWQSRGMELIGHEIKVTLSDWRAELDQPEKAERFACYCRRWFIAAPSSLAGRIKDEVPPAWGLLSVSDSGRTTEIRQAPARQPDDVPPWWWIGWLAQIDRQHKRRLPQLVADGMAKARQQLQAQVDAEVSRRRSYDEERIANLHENADRLKAATGINLHLSWPGDLEGLAAAWDLVRRCPSLSTLVGMLRRTADALEAPLPEAAVQGR